MNSFKNSILQIVLYIIFGLLCLGLYYFFTRYYNESTPPLRNADIPQETIDWFTGIWNDTTDIGGVYDTIITSDTTGWTNTDDVDSMLRLEDEYFVFYYSIADSAVEHKKALICQRYAHAAIPRGELIMKNYPYPNQLNGRKLPIYLANTDDDFRNICIKLGHGDPGLWAIGLYCFRFGGEKVYTDGIIISPRAWFVDEKSLTPQTDDNELKQTLWHEMNHFMYFTNWDFTQTDQPRLWYTEGLAEYFSENYGRLIEVGNYNGLNLTDDFRGGGNTEYWAGLSAYLCLEKLYGKAAVYSVVQTSYTNSIDNSLGKVIPGETLVEWNKQWHTFMRNGEYKNYKE